VQFRKWLLSEDAPLSPYTARSRVLTNIRYLHGVPSPHAGPADYSTGNLIGRALGGISHGLGYNFAQSATARGLDTPTVAPVPINYGEKTPGTYSATVTSHLLPGDNGTKTKQHLEKQMNLHPDIQKLFASKKVSPERTKYNHKIYPDETGQYVVQTQAWFS
jgi:hypothetical protein